MQYWIYSSVDRIVKSLWDFERYRVGEIDRQVSASGARNMSTYVPPDHFQYLRFFFLGFLRYGFPVLLSAKSPYCFPFLVLTFFIILLFHHGDSRDNGR